MPGVCGMLAFGSGLGGKTGRSIGWMRAMKAMKWGCGMVMVHNIGSVAGAASRKVNKVIDTRAAALINHFMNLGATEICKRSK